MKWTGAAIAEATGGRLLAEGPPGPIVTDTREPVEGGWFLALRGARFDAADFLPDAARGGCAGAVASRFPSGWDRGAVQVDDPLAALQDLARAVRRGYAGPVVGITGSVGKTTTRSLVAAALAPLGPVHQSRGNLNNHIGVPLTLLAVEGTPAAIVVEMGMSAPGEIALLQDIATPTIRVITNVRPVHLEGTGTLEGVARCKQELFDGARPGDVLVINQDDPRVAAMPRPAGTRVLSFGRSLGCDARWLRSGLVPGGRGTRIDLEVGGRALAVELAAPGLHLGENVAAAAAVALALGVAEDLPASLAAWRPVGMRMRVEERDGWTVLNDAYNASPASMRAALETLRAMPARRRWAVLGDMLELGDAEDRAHREVLRLALDAGLGHVLLVGPRFGRAARALGVELPWAARAEELPRRLSALPGAGDVVLLKGSRGMRVERFLLGLPGGGA